MLSMAAANTQAQENDKGGHRGLDFTVSPGYQINTGDGGGGSVSAEVSLGKRFNKNFYWGLTSGVLIPTGDGDVQIPIATDFKMFFPLKNKTFTPGFMVRGGYVINTSDGYEIRTGKHSYERIDAPDFIQLQAMPTINVALSGSVDFIFGVGYAHYIATKGGSSSGAVALNAAFNFHKSTRERTKPRVKAPTRERGIELTLEGGAGLMKGLTGNESGLIPNISGNIIASYKLNPNLNVGVGFGYSCSTNEAGCEVTYTYEDRYGDTYDNEYQAELGNVKTKRLFVRGEYALNSKTFTPFVSCDLGLNMYSYGDYYDPIDEFNEEAEQKVKKSGLFVSPAIGASLRVAPNSYLKLRLGYQLTPGSCKHKLGESENYKNVELKCIRYSQPYLNIGFTHTFNWGENWFK